MTPFSFEWQWNIGYIFFMGLFYLVLAIIGLGLLFTFLRTWLDLAKEDPSKPLPKND